MKVNTNVGGITEMNVYDDLAVQIFYGNEFLEVLNDVYNNTSTINELDISELFDRLSKINYQINVAIYKDKNIIKILQGRIKNFF